MRRSEGGPAVRRYELSDAEWGRLRDLLPGREGVPGRTAGDDRSFLNAVLWIARTGAPRRDLPERFGNPNSVFRRFNRWAERGVWARLLAAFQDPDPGRLMLDSSVIRAHQHAAGAKGGKPARRPAAVGAGSRRSRTWPSTAAGTRSGSCSGRARRTTSSAARS